MILPWIWPAGWGKGPSENSFLNEESSYLFPKWGGKLQERRWRMEEGIGEKRNKKRRWGCLGSSLFSPSLAASPQKTCLQLFLGSSSWFVGRILTRHFPDINPRLVFNLGKIISQISVRPSGDLNLIGDAGQFQIGQKLDAQAVSKEFSGAAKNVKLEYLRVTAQASTIIRRFLFQLKNFSFPWTISRCGCFDTWQMLQCTMRTLSS